MTKFTNDCSSLTGWTQLVGTWAPVSGQLECDEDNGATGKYIRLDSDVGGSDMYTELTFNPTQTNASSNTGPGVRHRAGATTGYQASCNLNDSHAFWRIVASVETQIATFTAALAAGDRLRLEAVGSTLRAKVNDALVALAQDTNVTDGQRGVGNGYNNNSTDVIRFDDFETGLLTDDLVAPYVADWGSQTARSAGSATLTTTVSPTVPAQVVAGDLVGVIVTVRAVHNVTAPAGEGWSQIQLASGNGLRQYLFAKVWGLGGQTDSTTPIFTKAIGSAGWFATACIIRNPKHATNPWTAVTDAIVASGQASNVAAATATAPDVADTGNNRTVLRTFSSADDNALGTPSEGVLVFGGAAYDATDIAQACSIREDVTLSGATGTATVALTVNGTDAGNGITAVLGIPSSIVNVTVDAAGLVATGVDPTLAGSGTAPVAPDPSALALAGVDPTFAGSGTTAIAVDAAVLALAGIDATFASGATAITVDPASLSLTGQDASAGGAGSASIVADPVAMLLSGIDGTLAGSGTAAATPDTAVLSLAGADSTLTGQGSALLAGDTAALGLAGVEVSAASGASPIEIPADPAALSLTGIDPAATGTGAAAIVVDPGGAILAGADSALTGAGSAPIAPVAAALQLTGVEPVPTGVGAALFAADPAALAFVGVELVLAVLPEGFNQPSDLELTAITDGLPLSSEPDERRLTAVSEPLTLVAVPDRLTLTPVED